MTRPLRIEFPGAVYHVTSRGDRQERIFKDDIDRRRLLAILDSALLRFDAEMFAFCLMGNHYHFVMRTRQPTLSRLMRQVNGEYTRAFNHRHELTGHVFQGRFHGVLVDSDSYLLTLCRYVEMNPVRAGLVKSPEQWLWSSYRAHVGLEHGRVWLSTDVVHGHLLQREVRTPEDRRQAQRLYAETATSSPVDSLWTEHLHGEIFLGSEVFASEMLSRAKPPRLECPEIAAAQRTRPGMRLQDWISRDRTRAESFRLAYSRGGLTMSEIARQAECSVTTVSRAIAQAERAQNARPDTAKRKT